MKADKLNFASDYLEGAAPEILERLIQTNLEQTAGYGLDTYSAHAKELIREACGAPEAEIFFLSGGTQTNRVAITSLLAPYQGVIAADSGHIAAHEAGAIENGGHKVLTLPHTDGKLSAKDIETCITVWQEDANNAHMVMPGLVYLSQPTEYGTLYSLNELKNISAVCRKSHTVLYVDGARLAYALACKENDVTLNDLANLCDAFYIGGTKCGALFGEALVLTKAGTVPHLFSIIKQQGALLAKGRIAGIQFETLFTDGLYERLGRHAVDLANRIRAALEDQGYRQPVSSPTNQIFLSLTDAQLQAFCAHVDYSFWEHTPDGHTVIRLATSWATREEDVDALIALL